MNDLPGRPISPLTPPAGALPDVVRRARGRRLRTALVSGTAVLAVIGGGVGTAVALGSSSQDNAVIHYTTPTDTPAPVEPSPSDSPPVVETTPTNSPAAIETTPPPAKLMTTFTGQVVDEAGTPIQGIDVTIFLRSSTDGIYHLVDHDSYSQADGTFTAPCGSKLLLATWGLGRVELGTKDLAARWYGTATTFAEAAITPCYPVGSTPGTLPIVMHPGGTITGTASGSVTTVSLICTALGLNDVPCGKGDVSTGAHFRFTGLPSGYYGVSSGTGAATQYRVTAGQTTTVNVS